jgi:hypothetical protein
MLNDDTVKLNALELEAKAQGSSGWLAQDADPGANR